MSAAADTTGAVALRDIVGQGHALGVLRSAIASGRVHHAWIFSGPRGVGKFTTAMAFASALLDPTTAPNLMGEHEPDPESETQRLIAGDAHPDLHVIRKELAIYSDEKQVRDGKQTNIAVDVVRTRLLDIAKLSAVRKTGSLIGKAFLVDEAELLKRVSQDALLKTLEEPPPGTVIILVTSAEEGLAPTIRSRCQRVAFTPLDDEQMRRWVIQRSGLTLSAEEIGWLIDTSEGSPGALIEAVGCDLHSWAQRLEPMLARADRGEFDPDLAPTIKDLVEGWAGGYVKANPNASKRAANDTAAVKALGLIADRARRSLREAAAAGRDTGRAINAIEAVERTRRRIGANVQLALAFEGLAAELVR
ncbi:MAG: hypothetical protein H6814_00220 [Phycisphaeraceae bacterium]|nr:hypothetical protein [Phycisphaeraceae bacterium]